jgi:hypothetical protein
MADKRRSSVVAASFGLPLAFEATKTGATLCGGPPKLGVGSAVVLVVRVITKVGERVEHVIAMMMMMMMMFSSLT